MFFNCLISKSDSGTNMLYKFNVYFTLLYWYVDGYSVERSSDEKYYSFRNVGPGSIRQRDARLLASDMLHNSISII